MKSNKKLSTGIAYMLFVFSLDWQRFSISEQINQASRMMREFVDKEGVSHRISFNFASLGAGERVLPFSGEDNVVQEDALNSLRLAHAKLRDNLQSDERFKANRDVLEMLYALRRAGHVLSAVSLDDTEILEVLLNNSWARDLFEDNVFGQNKRAPNLKQSFSFASIIATAVEEAKIPYVDTIVVADQVQAVQGACPLQPAAVVGYLDPYIEWDRQDSKIKELEKAGASYTSIGGQGVANLPWAMKARSNVKTQVSLMSYLPLSNRLN